MRILILGSAAGGGFPQWNCACEGCRRARAGRGAVPRTQSSIAVRAEGGRWVLVNASPDLRAQIEANPALQPQGRGRGSPIAAVVLTNADIDHTAGLLSMREGQPFALYATARVLGALAANPMFRALDPETVPRRPMALDRPFVPAGPDGTPLGLEFEAFAVPGKVALYREDPWAGPDLGTVAEDTVALRIGAPNTEERLFHMPGCAALPPWLAARLHGAGLLLFDGTMWSDDEMIRLGLGAKTARRMGHMPMSGADGSLAAFADVPVRRKVYVHVNNTNPVLLEDSAERRAVVEAGWEIARDGMEFTL